MQKFKLIGDKKECFSNNPIFELYNFINLRIEQNPRCEHQILNANLPCNNIYHM